MLHPCLCYGAVAAATATMLTPATLSLPFLPPPTPTGIIGSGHSYAARRLDFLHILGIPHPPPFARLPPFTPTGIIGSGHSYAARRLNSQHTVAGWMSEQMGGLSYLEYIRGLVKRVESDWDGVKADLEAIRKALLNR